MSINFKDLFDQLKTAIIGLAKENFQELVAEASSDGTSLLHVLHDDIKKYSRELAEGEISPNDFKLLMLGNEDLIKMSALTQAGLAQAKADQFKTEVFNTIINTIISFI